MDFPLDDESYAGLLQMLNDLCLTDRVGIDLDIRFIYEDYWLSDSAVIDNLAPVAGAWEVRLLFAHYRHPLKFIQRSIVTFASKKKAEMAALFMRRLAAKDQRGTLELNIASFNLPVN